MKVVFEPNNSKTNEYVNLFSHHFGKLGVDIYSLKEIFRNGRLLFSVTIVHLNWFENLPNGSLIKIFFAFIIKCFKLFSLVVLKKRIIWTMHNRLSHDVQYEILNKIMFKLLVMFSDVIVIHSRFSEVVIEEMFGRKYLNKIEYIPHPNYIGVYGEVIEKESEDESSLNLLFLGAVKPYKNIELLIDIIKNSNFSIPVKLVIAGKPISSKYKSKLLTQINADENIVTYFNFIENSEFPKLLSNCDLVILPYSLKSSLNSGTVILSFSYKKTVICPNIGTLLDFNPDQVFGYSYNSEISHYLQLQSKIEEACQSKTKEKNSLKYFGDNLFNVVRLNNDIKLITNRLYEIYKD